jgi:hypothetical protein
VRLSRLRRGASAGRVLQLAREDDNPPCAGFDAAGSDASAIAIADETMHAMGGRAAWDQVRVLEWTFFGRRKHVWDKWTGDVRIEEGERVTLMNVNTREGRVFDQGVEVTDCKGARRGARARPQRVDQRQLLAGDAVQAQGQRRHPEVRRRARAARRTRSRRARC